MPITKPLNMSSSLSPTISMHNDNTLAMFWNFYLAKTLSLQFGKQCRYYTLGYAVVYAIYKNVIDI
jgi:hypothetical protein